MVQYHKQQRGRPSANQGVKDPRNIRASKNVRLLPNSPTDEFKLKKGVLLRGNDGSVDCPIDIMCAQRIITKRQAEAAKIYGLIWSSAFGKPRRYSGNVWSGILEDAGRDEYNEDGDTIEAQNARRRRYDDIDAIVQMYGSEVRKCLRGLCEGHMPYYFKDFLYNASRTYNLDIELERIDAKLDKLKEESGERAKKEFRETFKRKKLVMRKLEVFSCESEPEFNIYIRGQLGKVLNKLAKQFGLQ